MALTNIQDVNWEILFQLEDDRDILKFCALSKHIERNICTDDFWREKTRRILLHLSQKDRNIQKPEEFNWKKWYFIVKSYVEVFSKIKNINRVFLEFESRSHQKKMATELCALINHHYEILRTVAKYIPDAAHLVKVLQMKAVDFSAEDVKGCMEAVTALIPDYVPASNPQADRRAKKLLSNKVINK